MLSVCIKGHWHEKRCQISITGDGLGLQYEPLLWYSNDILNIDPISKDIFAGSDKKGKYTDVVKILECYRQPMCTNHRQLLRYEKNGLESAFGTKKKHILKSN
jgi:hypothetical protein